MSANSAAVNIPQGATNSFSGRVHGVTVFARLGGDQYHDVGHAVLDRGGRLGDHGDPEAHPLPGRAKSQVVDQRRGQRARADSVDVLQAQAGVGERAPDGLKREAPRSFALQSASLPGVVDSDDGRGALRQPSSVPFGVVQFSSATTPR
jgi:hypothetical protein